MADETTKSVVEYYNGKGSDWAVSHNTENFWGEYMKRFNQLLPFGRVIEFGLGFGRDARILIDFGYEYFGTEPSDMINVARQTLPDAQLLRVAIEDLPIAVLPRFSGFWASAVLLHRPKARIVEDLRTIRKVLEKDAIGFISLKKNVDAKPSERVIEDGRFFAFYDTGEFDQKLAEGGFEIIEQYEKPMSEQTVWLIYLVKAV